MIQTQFDEDEAREIEFALKSQLAEMTTFIFGKLADEYKRREYIYQARALRKVLMSHERGVYVPLLDFGLQSGERVSDVLGMTEENEAGDVAYRG